MTSPLLSALAAAGLGPGAVEVAEALWLAQFLPATGTEHDARPASAAQAGRHRAEDGTQTPRPHIITGPPGAMPPREQARGRAQRADTDTTLHPVAARMRDGDRDGDDGAGWPSALPVDAPAVGALPQPRAIARALRPFKRRVATEPDTVVDESATARLIAEERLWLPVLTPAHSRWLDLCVVVDTSPSMGIWRRTTAEFIRLLETLGAFRTIRRVTIDCSAPAAPSRLGTGDGGIGHGVPGASAVRLGPGTAELVLVVTDGVGAAWRDGRMHRMLRHWAAARVVAAVSVLPRRLWDGGALQPRPARLLIGRPGEPNRHWRQSGAAHGPQDPLPAVPIPIVELSARWLSALAHTVAAPAGWARAAVLAGAPTSVPMVEPDEDVTPAERIRRFRAVASPTAVQLALNLAAAPLSLPVMRMVQRLVLPASETAHLAEVFLGGLLREISRRAPVPADQVEYDFVAGVREILLDLTDRAAAVKILTAVSQFVAPRLGHGFSFPAMLRDPMGTPLPAIGGVDRPLAHVSQLVLRRLGGDYARLADRLKQQLTGPRQSQPDRPPSTDVQSVGEPSDASRTVARGIAVLGAGTARPLSDLAGPQFALAFLAPLTGAHLVAGLADRAADVARSGLDPTGRYLVHLAYEDVAIMAGAVHQIAALLAAEQAWTLVQRHGRATGEVVVELLADAPRPRGAPFFVHDPALFVPVDAPASDEVTESLSPVVLPLLDTITTAMQRVTVARLGPRLPDSVSGCDYLVMLSPDDYRALHGRQRLVIPLLIRALRMYFSDRGVTPSDAIGVELFADASVRYGGAKAELRTSGSGRPLTTGPAHAQESAGPSIELVDTDGNRFAISRGGATVGRGELADLRLANRSVSRVHARISFDGTTMRVTDLGSANGTYVNDVRVTTTDLLDGDTIRFGRAALRVSTDLPLVKQHDGAAPAGAGGIIAGRYRLLDVVGSGATGITWKAEDTADGTPVAAKALTVSRGQTVDEQRKGLEHALDAIRTAASVDHPGVVRVHAALRQPAPYDGLWLIMEWLAGRTLSEVIEDGPLGVRTVASIGSSVLDALMAQHRAGITYRNLRPGNVFLCDGGRCVLTDASTTGFETDMTLTSLNLLSGAVPLMPPERAMGASAGPPGDLFMLGATLYEAVEGKEPFVLTGLNPIAAINVITNAPPRPLLRAGPLGPVLLGLLEKDPQQRWGANHALRELRRIAGGEAH
ncbi:SAV_2336 N-terminal domain-related protein [Dactylosporangium sp. CA-092794]|uniref:SAV_2336 N-terminal domain-related protein n=1 Tax=Dactylosporangium sp. CA-092794 TaxID=3239929 RepID=UPI003D8C3529